MPGTILGRDGRPLVRDRATLLVPAGMHDEDEPLVGRCHVCGARFYQGQEDRWQAHVVKCATAHIDEIRASAPSERNRGTPFDESLWDPEASEHLLKVGRRMMAEDRWEIKPNETVS